MKQGDIKPNSLTNTNPCSGWILGTIDKLLSCEPEIVYHGRIFVMLLTLVLSMVWSKVSLLLQGSQERTARTELQNCSLLLLVSGIRVILAQETSVLDSSTTAPPQGQNKGKSGQSQALKTKSWDKLWNGRACTHCKKTGRDLKWASGTHRFIICWKAEKGTWNSSVQRQRGRRAIRD